MLQNAGAGGWGAGGHSSVLPLPASSLAGSCPCGIIPAPLLPTPTEGDVSPRDPPLTPPPPPPQTQHTDQTLWRHLRPFSLRTLTVELHIVLYFSCLQITRPGTQWIPGVCKFKVYDFCYSLLLRSTWVWTLYFYTPITITKRKEKN